MSQNNISGGAKQGLGAALIIDGRQFEAAWLPDAANFTNETIDVTHAQTLNFKAAQVAELSEPLTIEGEFYFDPKLKSLVELMSSDGRNQKREIYFIFPKMSDDQGTTTENGYIYLPAGSIGIGTISTPVDDAMKAEFTIAGGIVNPEIEIQKVVAGNVPASTSVVTSNLSGTLADDVVATITATGVTHGATVFFDLGGTDAADFYLEGKFVKAVADGGGGAGVKSLTVSCAGYRAWAEEDTGEYLTGEAVGFTLS